MPALSLALDQLRNGGMVVLVDDDDRENEGDLVIAAQFATPEAINFMARFGRGLICLALTGAQVDRLGLTPMVANNRARRSTAFTVSIEAVDGITTGISAFDRAHTIQTAIGPAASPATIASPGHVFPLRAAEGGVLMRNGHTEGAVDLMRLAGLQPGGVICEVMRDDGEMARRPDLEQFAREHGLPMLSIQDIVAHRLATETLVAEISRSQLPTAFASSPFELRVFPTSIDGTEHLALTGTPSPPSATGSAIPCRNMKALSKMPDTKPAIALVVSQFNTNVTHGLRDGALAWLAEHGVTVPPHSIYAAPGAFEIPLIAKTLAQSGYDGVVCLGCVIKGDTAHFEYISESASHGLMQASLETGKPLTFGILTTYTEEQAIMRSRNDEHNKGREAAAACLQSLEILRLVAGKPEYIVKT